MQLQVAHVLEQNATLQMFATEAFLLHCALCMWIATSVHSTAAFRIGEADVLASFIALTVRQRVHNEARTRTLFRYE